MLINWKADLDKVFPGRCRFEEPMAGHNTYQVGGKAEAFVFPMAEEEWAWLSDFTRKRGLPLTILGHGANVIVSDSGLPGVVASTRLLDRFTLTGKGIKAQAGAVLDAMVAHAVDAGLAGMEQLSGIPGTVGGALRINAGAYDHEVYDHLVSFTALDPQGRIVRRTKADVTYGYRRVDGIDGLVFLAGEWELGWDQPERLTRTRHETLQTRAEKQPTDLPSAGSVFKRPMGDFASRLIDSCSLKGLTVGRAQVSPKHAGWIVNLGGATAQDIMLLIDQIRATVYAETGVHLEIEQVPLGF